MKIEYRQGDALHGPEPWFAHGCNGKGVMGSGIAKQVREEFPSAFNIYYETFVNNGLFTGDVITAPTLVKTIFNCITQATYGRDPDTRYVSYDAIRECMKKVNDYLRTYVVEYEDCSGNQIVIYPDVAMPLIGAGLGNGYWPDIAKIIEEESTNFNPVVYQWSDKGHRLLTDKEIEELMK